MKTIVISVGDDGSIMNIAETSVSFDEIEKFVKGIIDKENASKDDEPELLKYIKSHYPKFYKNAMEEEILDEPTIKAIEFLAGKVGKTPEEFVDLMVQTPKLGLASVQQFAFCLASVRSMWIVQNNYKAKH